MATEREMFEEYVMRQDAAFEKALIEAMECEYRAAKAMRGKRQFEWITIYALLRRLVVAANHLADAIPTPAEPGESDSRCAERYRWLRDSCGVVEYKAIAGSIGPGMLPSGQKLDQAIDAAMATSAKRREAT